MNVAYPPDDGRSGVNAVAVVAIVILVILAFLAVYFLALAGDDDGDIDVDVNASPVTQVIAFDRAA